LISFELKQ